ncbi:MAG: tRNA preQ1(34) S-adenosylmethionine ribosyltransferase-isomerase QueA [Planctomycetes bacterium]|nr:tRNA preQ1(34) S-adenosylmethionine ribosyltransferase-isomerase QueA [Planctomycetota bacterium]
MPFFDYTLPEHLIAQHPATERDAARLLVVRRATGAIEHRVFRDLPDLLAPGDLVVLNDTRVLPARVVGRRESTGGKWEGLFLRATEAGPWEMLAQTRSYPEVGAAFVTDTGLRLVLRGRTADRHWLMEPDAEGAPPELLSRYGHVPLPPYIRKGQEERADRERYQTVYANAVGSVAAPTAGLHFTPAVFDALAARGIGTARVTLHVGLGTFAPVKEADPTKHVIHREWCEVTPAAVDAVRATKARGGRVVAVGTTTTRTLESAATEAARGFANPFCGETGLFIHEPFAFRVVDALVTNFHLPRTTLLLLVGALAGSERLRAAYAEAVAREYRFFSYGDAMLVL